MNGLNGIIEQEKPEEIFPKFDIFNSDLTKELNITEELKGSPINLTEWKSITSKMNLFASKLRNISSIIKLNRSRDEYIIKHYDDVMWSVDKLKDATPDINWDKIFLGIFGTTNYTGKIQILDTKFIQHINEAIKRFDKRYNFSKKHTSKILLTLKLKVFLYILKEY